MPRVPLVCLECGKKFFSATAAERAAFGDDGCPKCGGSDIDVYIEARHRSDEPDYGGAFDEFTVSSDADPSL